MENMVNVYVGNLFTNEGDKKDIYQEACLENGVYCIGWSVKQKPHNKDVYQHEINSRSSDEKAGFNRAFDKMCKIEVGDFIWTRNTKTGMFYLGKVYSKNAEVQSFYEICPNEWCLAVCCKWGEPLNLDYVPGVVVNAFPRGTIKRSSTSDNPAMIRYFESLYDTKLENCKLPKDKIYDFLCPEDQEDLLGLYLQKEENYLIYPSGNKSGTAAYEYVLVKEEKGKIIRAIVQCKMGNTDIFLNRFHDYDEYQIYCVTCGGDVYYDERRQKVYQNGEKSNVKKFKMGNFAEDKLLQWAWDKNNKPLLPKRMQQYLNICCENLV